MWPLIKNIVNLRANTTDGKIDAAKAVLDATKVVADSNATKLTTLTTNVTTVDTVVDSILAQLGIDNPSTADKTTLMNYLLLIQNLIGAASPAAGATTNLFAYDKLLADRIGAPSPTVADQTNLFNFLKQIKDGMPTGAQPAIVSSNNARHSWATERIHAAGITGSMLLCTFIPAYTGTVRLKFDMALTSAYSSPHPLFLAGVMATDYNTLAPGKMSQSALIGLPAGSMVNIEQGSVLVSPYNSVGYTSYIFEVATLAGVPIMLAFSKGHANSVYSIKNISIGYDNITGHIVY